MARILDFYEVRWEYEPTTFPILWNLDGDVVESFAPDFYLPELDIFLEMTTLKQRLVRKKNRKLRRLRELYPDVRIKLFYARDFRAMMLKYGRLGLAAVAVGNARPGHPGARRRRGPDGRRPARGAGRSRPRPRCRPCSIQDGTGHAPEAGRSVNATPWLARHVPDASEPSPTRSGQAIERRG